MTGVRAVGRGDDAGVLDVLRAAFGQEDEARLVERMWADASIIAERLIAADGRIVAYAGVSPATIAFGEETTGDALGLAPVAVAPDEQRQGHGVNVVEAVIAAAFEREPRQLMFVLGEPSYYQRFGFVPAAPLGYRWEGGDVGVAFQVRAGDGAPRPVAHFNDGTHHWQSATVHYGKAFRMFDAAAG